MPSTNQSTIVAAFRNIADAQAAAQELQTKGIDRNDIYMETGQSSQGGTETTGTTHRESGVIGWFKSLFREDDDYDRAGYEEALGSGHVLLRVDAREDQFDMIADVLERHSSVDVHREAGNTQAFAAASGAAASGAAASGAAGTGTASGAGTRPAGAINVVEEELKVGKRRILRGGIRVYSRIVEEPVQETVTLQDERARVERRPVNREASAADLKAGQEQVIEVEEFAEEPVISKEARVVEEVRIGKETSRKTETVRDSVRHTEVDVEQTPGSARTNAGAVGTAYDDSDFRSDFTSNYGTSGQSYDDYAPSYRYGYDMASDPRYKGRSFNEAERDLQRDYASRYPNSTWEKMKNAVRYGWDKVTGRA
jgi:uncharacterized protein (TIGR02271 family)